MVIANDHYQSIGIVCLSVIRGRSTCHARKRSISFNFNRTPDLMLLLYFGFYRVIYIIRLIKG